MFIGLNPSTADETEDDPTIRRCIGFAKDWGAGGLRMTNLFAFRATDPDEMERAKDPIGPENDVWLLTLAVVTFRENMPIVAAWGTRGAFLGRARAVFELLHDRELKCLGKTKEGHPRHPLYLPKTAELEPWP